MQRLCPFVLGSVLYIAMPAFATVFAALHGIVHDPDHRPIPNCTVTLEKSDSSFTLSTQTDLAGEFTLPEAPIGDYTLTVSAPGFATAKASITLVSGTNPIAHILLAIEAATQTVTVVESEANMGIDTVTPTTTISRAEIEKTPGASRTLATQMITDFVPGAYMTHDMLHIRGGHQTSWLIDGVSIPDTKIASTVGPQIDPKDIDSLEVLRGSYSADIGDRTYGVFNVLPRNGFERNREGELSLMGGNLYSGEAQFSLGDHTAKTAWYASLSGSRSSYGLAPPVAALYHDATNSQSGFVSLIRNETARDQLRVTGQFRQEFFQIPYDPNPDDWEQMSEYYESYGLRDRQRERDTLVIANWIHTVTSKTVLSVAPFYHMNQADYDSPNTDQPVATTWHQLSNYGGGQADLRTDLPHNNFSAGMYSFYQAENDLFGVKVNDGSASSEPNVGANSSGELVEFYLADHFRVGRFVTLLGGERFSIYRGSLNETAIYPRLGATAEIPRLHWILRGFYGHFFQPAPLLTVSSSVLNYASNLPAGQNTFEAIPSERDEEHQVGIQIPWKGWALDLTNFKSRVNNFLDHANLGESNMYFPIAVDGALVRAWEMTLRSPALWRFGRFYTAYSNQIAEQRGAIVGGFSCSLPGDPVCNPGDLTYTPVDHDQRQTLNMGVTANLPLHAWFSSNVYYGSGFSNGLAGSGLGPYQGTYLPVHTTFDLSLGRAMGERWKVSASVLNATNHRVLLDNSVTIGGFHYNDPRMFTVDVRYRFRF